MSLEYFSTTKIEETKVKVDEGQNHLILFAQYDNRWYEIK